MFDQISVATPLCQHSLRALVAGICLCFSTSSVAVDQFLSIPGVDGESQDAMNLNAIDVLAWSWGVSDTRNGKKCQFQDVSVTKFVDTASPLLLMGQVANTVYPSATLKIRATSGVTFIVIELSDVRVTSLSTGGSGGEQRLTENVSLGFESATYTYTPQQADGSLGTPVSATMLGC